MEQEIRLTYDNDFDFHWKFGRFEIATVRERYTNEGFRYDNDSPIRRNIPVELVKWDEDHASCWVVAWWVRSSEGYELRFIGGRPFHDIEPDEIAEIWRQLQVAQSMLDMYFEASSDE